MRKSIQLLAAATSIASLGLMTAPAHADNAIIKIGKNGSTSSSHKLAYIKAKITCSEDTTSGYFSVTLTQVTVGGTQTATGTVAAWDAFECTGSEEKVWVPVRRPTGGFKWESGKARVTDLHFYSEDPSGGFDDHAKGRTVNLR